MSVGLTLSTQQQIRRTTTWWLWCALFAVAIEDALVGYLSRSLGIPGFSRPWLLLAIPTAAALIISAKEFRRSRFWALLLFAGVLFGLAVGVLTIDLPRVFSQEGLYKVTGSELITMSLAFGIGFIWIKKQDKDGYFLADMLLLLSAIHALVCLLALSKISPDLLPIIDSPYWRDGRPVSRPEITTDQTRQVLYIIPALCIIFIRSSTWRLVGALTVAAGAAYITFRIQSRGSMLLLALFVPLALLIGIFYRVQKFKIAIPVLFFACLLALTQLDKLIDMAADVLWRFDQLDQSYGGRLLSIIYLFQTILDPSFWLPKGYGEFFARYGSAPHSFPTMLYMMGGIISLLCYLPLVLLPLWLLGRKMLRGSATGTELICFFLAAFSLALQITQPVITHEIFWLIIGAAVGAISDRTPKPFTSRAHSTFYGFAVPESSNRHEYAPRITRRRQGEFGDGDAR